MIASFIDIYMFVFFVTQDSHISQWKLTLWEYTEVENQAKYLWLRDR